jgi:hypothetical protein
MPKQGEEYWKFKQCTTRPIPTVEQTLQHTDLIDRMIGTNIYYFCPLEKNDPDYEFGKGEWLKGEITGKEELDTGKWVHKIQLIEDGVPIYVDLLFDQESWFFYPPVSKKKKDPTLEADCHLVMDWDKGPFANEPGDRTSSEGDSSNGNSSTESSDSSGDDDVSQAAYEPVEGDSSSENEPLSEKFKRISKPQPSRASSRNAVKVSKAKKGKAAVAVTAAVREQQAKKKTSSSNTTGRSAKKPNKKPNNGRKKTQKKGSTVVKDPVATPGALDLLAMTEDSGVKAAAIAACENIATAKANADSAAKVYSAAVIAADGAVDRATEATAEVKTASAGFDAAIDALKRAKEGKEEGEDISELLESLSADVKSATELLDKAKAASVEANVAVNETAGVAREAYKTASTDATPGAHGSNIANIATLKAYADEASKAALAAVVRCTKAANAATAASCALASAGAGMDAGEADYAERFKTVMAAATSNADKALAASAEAATAVKTTAAEAASALEVYNNAKNAFTAASAPDTLMSLRRNCVASSTEPNPPTGNKSGNGVGSSTESAPSTNWVDGAVNSSVGERSDNEDAEGAVGGNGAGISYEESSDNNDFEGAPAGDGSASGIVRWSQVPKLDINEEVTGRGERQATLRCKEADKRAAEIKNAGEPEYTMIRYVSSDDEWYMFSVLSGRPGHGKWECVQEGHIWGALTTNGMDAKVEARKNPSKSIVLRLGNRNPNKTRREAQARNKLKRKLVETLAAVRSVRELKRRNTETLAQLRAARAQRVASYEADRLQQVQTTRCFMVALENLGFFVKNGICDSFATLNKYVTEPLRPCKWGWPELTIANIFLPTLEVFVAKAQPEEKYILRVCVFFIKFY